MKQANCVYDHWQSLKTVVDETERALPSGIRGERLLRDLLRSLSGYGDRHIEMERSGTGAVEPPTENQRRLIAAAAQDLAWIERAAYQRAWGSLTAQTALDRFDAWADLALAPARRHLTPGLASLTCLDHTTALRYLPYGPLALVSLPYRCAATAGWKPELLEAPRVIGRFLYRQGQLDAEPSRSRPGRFIAELSEWSLNWLEAVFGEVYAGLVAGPAAGLYCQDQVMASPPHRLNRDDGENVPPVLAPKIHIHVLEWLGLEGWAGSLSARWTRWLAQSGAPRTLRLKAAVSEIFLVHPRDELMAMVDFALDLLQTCLPDPDTGWCAHYAGRPAYAPEDLERLYTDWAPSLEPAAGAACWPAPRATPGPEACPTGPAPVEFGR